MFCINFYFDFDVVLIKFNVWKVTPQITKISILYKRLFFFFSACFRPQNCLSLSWLHIVTPCVLPYRVSFLGGVQRVEVALRLPYCLFVLLFFFFFAKRLFVLHELRVWKPKYPTFLLEIDEFGFNILNMKGNQNSYQWPNGRVCIHSWSIANSNI